MAVDRIGVDEQEVKGVELSKAEKNRIKRQQRKLKKFGLKDEATMGKVELFFYQLEKKRRIKKKKRVSRSLAGDIALFVLLAAFGCFSAYPLVYSICAAFKPLSELFIFPPKLFFEHPTLDNFSDLANLLETSWVPFSRYFFNTIWITLAGKIGHVVF